MAHQPAAIWGNDCPSWPWQEWIQTGHLIAQGTILITGLPNQLSRPILLGHLETVEAEMELLRIHSTHRQRRGKRAEDIRPAAGPQITEAILFQLARKRFGRREGRFLF